MSLHKMTRKSEIYRFHGKTTVGTVLTTEVAVNFENFFEGVLAVN